jgi:hypothetical protein
MCAASRSRARMAASSGGSMSPVSIDMSCPSFIAAPRICDRRSAIRSMLAGVRRSVSRRGRSPRARARPAPIAMSPARPVARPPIAPSRARRLDGTLRWRCDLGVSVMGGRLAVGRAGRMCGTVARRRPATSAGCSDRIGVPVARRRHRVAPVDREGRAAGLLRAVERGIGVGHQPVGTWPFRVGRGHRDTRWRPIRGKCVPSNGIGRSICGSGGTTGRRWPPPRRCRAGRRGTRPRPPAPPCPARAGPPAGSSKPRSAHGRRRRGHGCRSPA